MDSLKKEYDFTKIPFDDVVHVGQRSLLYTDIFSVSFLLGKFCNYSCSYCWPHASSKVMDHRPTEVLIATLDEIKRQARDRGFNSFSFSFSGGEPTLHKGYLDLLKHYSDDSESSNYQSAHMTSNISPSKVWFKKYIKATENLHQVSVTASYHKEFANRDEFCEKLIFLQEHDIDVTINIVMVPDNFENLWNDALYFHQNRVNVTLKPQSDEKASKVVSGYSKEMFAKLQRGLPQADCKKDHLEKLGKKSNRPKKPKDFGKFIKEPDMDVSLMDKKGQEWFIDQAERFNAFNFNKFKNWDCAAGYRSLIIQDNGLVERSYSCVDEPLGHIETGFKLFDSMKPCVTNSCVSSADSKIPKRKQGCKLPL